MHKAALLLVFLLPTVHRLANAGPARRSSRMAREVYPELEPEVCIVGDVVYGAEEAVPADQPCLKCRCQPPGVQCEAIRCVKKPGCRALHRPNKCCPDYQCECEHEGRTFANGERLKSPPGGECKVCYCRGGEVQCADVSCYIRTDCEAKTVPGQCCPKYDHCPPKEPLQDRTNYQLELHPLTELLLQNVTTDDSNRILDNTPDQSEMTTAATSGGARAGDAERPRITIQEIIPEVKEIPITSAPTRGELAPGGGPAAPTAANDVGAGAPDAEAESSEFSEVFQQPPPVLRIGDKLLFLKQGELLVPEKGASTPTSVITLIGAEGLQRGFEESAENHESGGGGGNDLELSTADSTHILSLVRRRPGAAAPTTAETWSADGEHNPAYPPLPDAMANEEEKPAKGDAKVPPDTVPDASHTEGLKNNTAEADEPTQHPTATNIAMNDTTTAEFDGATPAGEKNTTAADRSTEGLDASVEDSGEATTSSQEAVHSTNESASAEAADDLEAVDMLSSSTGAANNSTVREIDDVETVTQRERDENATTEAEGATDNPLLADVETITPEKLQILPAKTVLKRENAPDDEADAVFAQLNDELNADGTERNLSPQEEQQEADEIFKQLLAESKTPAPPPKSREELALRRVTDALAKFALRGRKNPLDSGILSILTDFFSSQYKHYQGTRE